MRDFFNWLFEMALYDDRMMVRFKLLRQHISEVLLLDPSLI